MLVFSRMSASALAVSRSSFPRSTAVLAMQKAGQALSAWLGRKPDAPRAFHGRAGLRHCHACGRHRARAVCISPLHELPFRVAFGTARSIDDIQGKAEALRVISDHLIAGRWEEVRNPTAKELKATSVLEFTIEDASAKTRSGPPMDDEEDYALPVWAGVVPLHLRAAAPLRDPRLEKDVAMPAYVRGFHANGDEG